MASNAQGVYAPLPQSLSDSDSEKEINQPTRMKFSSRKLQNGIHDFTNNAINGYTLPKHIIMTKSKKGFWGMSTARKCAFIASIALCFLVVIIFIWVLPCSSHNTCPIKITSWKNAHDDVEFKGRINIIRGPYGNAILMALLTKKNIFSMSNQSGLIALQINNGAMLWNLAQVRTGYDLNCGLIDVNADGVNDCLLLGEIGLEAINPLNAEIIWSVHTKEMFVSELDFPILLPDLNHDGINEIISVMNANSFHNKIVIICGRTGRLLGDVIVKVCVEIIEFKMDDALFIFLCKNGAKSNYYKIALNDLKIKLNNATYLVQADKIEYNQAIASLDCVVNGHRLIVENVGQCPNCKSTIRITNENTHKRIYGWSHEHTYAMNPASFAFKPTQINLHKLQGHINGFVLKLWQWALRNKRHIQHNNTLINAHNISEKIVLITFNDTGVHVINVSLIQITQLCLPTNECQPDVFNRNDSLQITDLDLDGSQELISYSSSFKCDDANEADACRLVSNIEVVRLEAELPKLYTK